MDSRDEKQILKDLIRRYQAVEAIENDIFKAYEILRSCFEQGGKLLIAGNGGS